MEIACCSTSLMASRLPAKLPFPPYTSLAASNSVFFTSGGRVLARTRLALVSGRRRRGSSGGLGCRCLFGLGVPELVVIAGVAALLFGTKKLPEMGRSIGKTVKSFQQVRLSCLVSDFCSQNLIFRAFQRVVDFMMKVRRSGRRSSIIENSERLVVYPL